MTVAPPAVMNAVSYATVDLSAALSTLAAIRAEQVTNRMSEQGNILYEGPIECRHSRRAGHHIKDNMVHSIKYYMLVLCILSAGWEYNVVC
jgi:hypothetical protein